MKEEKLIIHPKRPKGDDGYKTFSVRIREDVVQRIDEISAQTGRSRNELIGILLEFSLDRCSIEPKSQAAPLRSAIGIACDFLIFRIV